MKNFKDCILALKKYNNLDIEQNYEDVFELEGSNNLVISGIWQPETNSLVLIVSLGLVEGIDRQLVISQINAYPNVVFGGRLALQVLPEGGHELLYMGTLPMQLEPSEEGFIKWFNQYITHSNYLLETINNNIDEFLN